VTYLSDDEDQESRRHRASRRLDRDQHGEGGHHRTTSTQPVGLIGPQSPFRSTLTLIG
jgi:hypothetical protein